MRNPTRKSLWIQAIVLALAASLVASPALAGSRKGHGKHGKHRGYDHGREWRHRGGHHVHYAGCGHGNYGYRYRGGHRHHHHGSDVDDVLLALGLTAVGLTAVALWAGAQQPVYGPYGGAPPAPAARPIDWNEVDDDVTLVSEGYNDRGEFCREFQKEIVVGGRVERGYGLACLQEDGSWRIGP